jgi:vacuolar protein sorting-associated protein 13A/C
MAIALSSKRRLEVNITHTFIELAMNSLSLWNQQGEEILKTSRGSNAPFLIRNRTGCKISIWAESDDMTRNAPSSQLLADGDDLPWRMDDWKTMREAATTAVVHNSVGISLQGTSWERVKHISVEREGEQVYRLKPKIDQTTHRMLCEVKLVNNVKIVTFRSTFKIENLTMVPSEMIIVDANGKKASTVFKLRESNSRDFYWA